LRPQRGKLFGGELDHEICREALAVAANLFVEALGGDLVEGSELGVQEHFVAAQDEDGVGDVLDGHQGERLSRHGALSFSGPAGRGPHRSSA
jgi:hypothetical protein